MALGTFPLIAVELFDTLIARILGHRAMFARLFAGLIAFVGLSLLLVAAGIFRVGTRCYPLPLRRNT